MKVDKKESIMFVSSYNTYINTTANKRVSNEKGQEEKRTSESFSTKLLQEPQQSSVVGKSLPVNYISNYKSLHTRQQLQEQLTTEQNREKTEEVQKFTKISSQGNAKVAYEENSKMFSFLVKPKQTLSQTPQFSSRLPQESQKSQEAVIRKNMINTYTANDNYYNITAA